MALVRRLLSHEAFYDSNIDEFKKFQVELSDILAYRLFYNFELEREREREWERERERERKKERERER